NLIQQAYTILQENMISEIIWKFYGEEYLMDYDKRENKVKVAFSKDIRENYEKFTKEKGRNLNKEELDEIIEINKTISDEYIAIFEELSMYRNDINHAGMKKGHKDARNIISKIVELNEKLKKCREK
ncbi:MAG: hypothetical protein ACTSSF_13145, partial [Candidatus Heimdallarchaeaceae archaeon]